MKKSCCDSLREIFSLKSEAEFKEFLQLNGDLNVLSLDDHSYLLACYYYASGDFEKIEVCIKSISPEFDGRIHYLRGRVLFSQCEYRQALNEFDNARSKGNLRSCYFIGMAYHFGLGVNVDLDKASSAYKVGAEAGYYICKRMCLFLDNASLPMKLSTYITLIFSIITTAFEDECNEVLADTIMWKNPKSRKILISATQPSSTVAKTTLSAETP